MRTARARPAREKWSEEDDVEYKVVRALETRGAVDPGEPEEVQGTLLVATKTIAHWDKDHRREGYDSCALTPAFYNGVRAWVLCESWQAGGGYSASGTQERVLEFEAGVKIICGLDLWDEVFMRELVTA